nr:NADH dehydrogenase subunit 4 [Peloridora minuta]
MLKYVFFICSFCFFCLFGLWWEVIISFLLVLLLLISTISFFNFTSMLSFGWGGDYISMNFLILSIWIIILMFLASVSILWVGQERKLFMLCIIVLLLFIFLFFFSCYLFLFYFFFESSLIPTVILIVGWGYQPERLGSIMYLLIYTFMASLPLLLTLFFIYSCLHGSFLFFPLSGPVSLILYFSLVIAFLVSIPLFGFHIWLLKAHVEAPVSGSMILAGVLLKLGGYGLMRVHNMTGGVSSLMSLPWFIVSMWGMVLVGCFCLVQIDLKLPIAYSSVAHMSYVISGIMTLSQWGLTGALIMMIGHGLCSSGLFCLSNLIYERSGSRSLLINRGVVGVTPTLSLLWFLLCSSNMAGPPSLNLVGEIFLSISILSWSYISFLFLMLGCFLNGAYSLFMFAYSQHGYLHSGFKFFSVICNCEFMLIVLHWLPLNVLFLFLELFCN